MATAAAYPKKRTVPERTRRFAASSSPPAGTRHRYYGGHPPRSTTRRFSAPSVTYLVLSQDRLSRSVLHGTTTSVTVVSTLGCVQKVQLGEDPGEGVPNRPSRR